MAALTFSHLSSDTFEQESQRKAGRKRPRIREAVSCWQCRSRKIRCDRELPCRPCVERDAGSKCTYSQPKTGSSSRPTSAPAPKVAAEEALAQPSKVKSSPNKTTSRKASSPTKAATNRTKPAVSQDQPVPATTHGTQSPPTRSPPSAGQPFRDHVFQGSNRKTRLVGVSHWMAPCNEMMVVRAMVTRSREFQSSMRAFAELKERLRQENTITVNLPPHAAAADGRMATSVLFSVLPDRLSCEEWIGRYFRGYGRIYDIVDPATLATDLHQAFSSPPDTQHDYATAMNSIYILRILVTVALGMQMSEPHRLPGRRLGQLVEDFVHRAARIQKPCIGSVQVLLLLVLLKTITASDTDGEHDSMGLLGLTGHVVSSMGLHRDPALFEDVPPYYAEQRKRLWACFLRLNLAYCIRTGTQLALRLEDSDCPLPTPSVLEAPPTDALLSGESTSKCAREWNPGEKEAENDASFCYAAARLANVVAPLHQTLCSARPRVTAEQQAVLQSGFAALVSELPPSLQSGTTVTDPIMELQRTLLSIGMHSVLLVVCLSQVFSSTGSLPTSATAESSAEAYSSQRPQLLEIWDYTISILNQFQNLCQEAEGGQVPKAKSKNKNKSQPSSHPTKIAANDASIIAHHLMWTDAGRAALSACLVVGRLCRQDLGRVVSFSVHPQQQHTAAIFQQMLYQSLSVLLQLWRSKCHLGPVTAKTSLLLAVTVAVTTNLYSDFDGVFDRGVAAADQLIADMQRDLEQRQNLPAAGVEFFDSATRADDAATQFFATTYADNGSGSSSSTAPPVSSSDSGLADLISPSMVPHSSYTWAPTAFFDSGAPQLPDLSTSSSTASHTASPDFGAGGGGTNDILGMDFAPDMAFPYALSSSYEVDCPPVGDFDSTFLDFSGDTIMNMF